MPLKDILIDNPKILFVGINPGLRSEARGHHFAGNGNPFWRLLYASRLIPVEITDEDRQWAIDTARQYAAEPLPAAV